MALQLTTKPSCKPSIRGEIPLSSTFSTAQSVKKSPKGPRNQVSKGMPSSSPAKTSTSSLSLDSVHSGQSSPSIDPNHSQQTPNAAKPPRSDSLETQNQTPVYTPTRDQPSSSRFPPEQRASQSPPVVNLRQNPHQQLNTSPSSLSMLPTGFASLHVGIGSPKLEFGRDWPGTGRRRRESSLGPEAVENDRLMRERAAQEQRRMEESGSGRENGGRGGYVDRVSGLHSPPGTESDIAPSVEGNHSLSRNDDNVSARYEQQTSPPQQSEYQSPPSRRVPPSSSSHHLSRRTSSYSGSSTTHTPESTARQSHARQSLSPHKSSAASMSLSRSSSSTSAARRSGSVSEQRRAEIFGGSRESPALELSKSQSHSPNQTFGSNGNPSSPKRRAGPPPLDLSPSSDSRGYSPETNGTSKPQYPPVAYSNKVRESVHRLGSSSPHPQSAETVKPSVQGDDNLEQRQRGRRQSQGEIMDEKIKEIEEKIAHVRVSPRKRRSIDINSSTTTTPVRENIRKYTPHSHDGGQLQGTEASPSAASPHVGRSMTRSMDLETAMEMVNRDSPLKHGSYEHEAEEERMKSGERSGGSGSSRPRKALPADFRNGSFKTASSQLSNDLAPSTRSRLRQMIDSPAHHHSPSPLSSRFSTTSRLAREYDPVRSPSRASHRIEGLERSSTVSAFRARDPSGYAQRGWSQSMSGLPHSTDAGLHRRGSPRELDRYLPESVLDSPGNRSRYHERTSTAPNNPTDQEKGTKVRRGVSMLISERDLANANLDLNRRFNPIAPGDSVSVIGTKSERDTGKGKEKDPLDVIRRLEEQRAESKRRWEHMPRSSTSMSSMRDIYRNPYPRMIPASVDIIRHRRSMEHDAPASPLYGRGGGSRLSMVGPMGLPMPATEPRQKRSLTSLGGRSSASLSLASSSEHGRLLFDAYRSLESKLSQDGLSTEVLGPLGSAAKASESANTVLQTALNLVKQISLDAVVDEDSTKVREGYKALTSLLREAGRASDQNVRDMTRIMLELPKLLRHSNGHGMPPSTSFGSVRPRRSESLAALLAHESPRHSSAGDERPRRWTPSAASVYSEAGAYESSPLQNQFGTSTPRRSFDVLRASTSIGDSYSPLSARSSRERERPGSAMSSLMNKVRNMGLTPKKGAPSPKSELATIEQSPDQPPAPQVPMQPYSLSPLPQSSSRSSLARSRSSHSSSSRSRSVSPEKASPAKSSPERLSANILKKKSSVASNHTVKASFPSLPSTSRGKPTTAISQVTAGDLTPETNAMLIHPRTTFGPEDEPNSPMSRFSFRSSHQRMGSRDEEGSENGDGEIDWTRERRDSGIESDAVSILEQNLVSAAKAREEGQNRKMERGTEGKREEEGKTKRMTDRLKASLRRSSNKHSGDV
ncbi:hypothetical protein D1P53_000927 [Cryptococcus gattii VGV]|nr:hypothetical protein D1P53_000927 [Cryptococcus gattii VGV]